MGRLVISIFVIRLLALASMAAGPAWAEADVLERPALQTAKAKDSAMLAVTRAGNRIVAVGERGIALFSDDVGVTWRQAVVPVSVNLTNVRFVNERTGWAVGHSGIVLRSTDGGRTWETQLDGRKAASLSLALAKQVAEQAPGDSKAMQMVAEAERLVADGPDKPFLDLWFRNETEGFVVGAYGLILGTTDGGKTWRSWQDRLDNGRGRHLYSVDAMGSEIYLAGELGALYRSTDSGTSFIEMKAPYSGTYFGVRYLPAGGVLVFGLRGNVYSSPDGVGGWQKVSAGDESALNAANVLDDGSIVLVDQSGRLLRSNDGGRSFQQKSGRQGFPLTGVVQASDGFLILTGLGGIVRLDPLKSASGAPR